MYSTDGKDGKAAQARERAQELARRLREKFPQSDYAARASTLVFKLDQGIAVYGIEHQ
jgi:outer membrane protein assembly factor BamD (BamD/ComL family)